MENVNTYAGPLSMLVTIIGGAAWLTKMHQLANQNRKDIEEIKKDSMHDKNRLSIRIERLENATGRMDGKLDMLIKMIEGIKHV